MLRCPGCLRRRRILAATLGALLPWRARAKPAPGPLDPKLHDWYQRAMLPGTAISCCGQADGRVVDARRIGAQWQVFIGGRWWPVPASHILRDYPPYPDGSAVVWIVLGPDGPSIYCFRPPVASG